MKYTVVTRPSVRKEILRLDPVAQGRVLAAVEALADTPRPPGCIKMTNLDEYRIRVGSYRIRYRIDDAIITVTVVKVGHRRDIYR